MKKTFKVVMLPTEKASKLFISSRGDLLYGEIDTESEENCGSEQHLYIISDEEIKEGDWVYDTFDLDIYQVTSEHLESMDKQVNTLCKKVIASTDITLYYTSKKQTEESNYPIPQIPKSFIQAYIKAYNEDKPITEVDLEVQERFNACPPDPTIGIYPKTRSDNTVIVHQSKTYTRDEVEVLLDKLWDMLHDTKNYSSKRYDIWKGDNLK